MSVDESAQPTMFDVAEEPKRDPVAELRPYNTILVHFATREDRAAFEQAIGQRIARSGRGQGQLWFPKAPTITFGGPDATK